MAQDDGEKPLETTPGFGAADIAFFAAETYGDWVRGLVSAMFARPGAVGLFDASMPEPTDLLAVALRDVMEAPGRPRVRSVMGAGNPRVVDALARRYGVAPDRVLCTAGSLSAVAVTLKAMLGGGGRLLLERPHLDTLRELAEGLGAPIDLVDRTGPDAHLDPAALQAALRPDTRAVLITNLHNPTGAYLREADLQALATAMGDHPAKIVVDEVYADFAHLSNGERPAAALGPAFVSINSLSKVYGLAALKCGWIVADADTVARIAAVHGREAFGVSKLTHAVASAVLEDEAPFAAFVDEVLEEGRPVMRAWAAELAFEGLIEGEVPPFGCLYFPRLVGAPDTRAFAAGLWRDHGVAVAPGELFQRPGHVRIGFGRRRAVLAPALARLAEALRASRGSPSSSSEA